MKCLLDRTHHENIGWMLRTTRPGSLIPIPSEHHDRFVTGHRHDL